MSAERADEPVVVAYGKFEPDEEGLREALHRCSTEVDVNEQAWTMRRAFDAILGEGGPGTD